MKYLINSYIHTIDTGRVKDYYLSYYKELKKVSISRRGISIPSIDRAIQTIKENGMRKADSFYTIGDVKVYKYDPILDYNPSGHSYYYVTLEGEKIEVNHELLTALNMWIDGRGYIHTQDVERGYMHGEYYTLQYLYDNNCYQGINSRYYNSALDAYECDSSIFLDSYHSGRSPIVRESADLWIGFEAEKEDREVLLSRNLNQFKNQFPDYRLERDASLGRYGFECISPVFPLDSDNDLERIVDSLHEISAYINADATENCGGHISVSTTDSRNGYETLYEELEEYLPLLYALYPSRTSGDYCTAKYKGDEKCNRDALHLSRNGRIEIRIFPAIRNIEQLLFRMKLVRFMVKNSAIDNGLESVLKSGDFKNLMAEVYGSEKMQFKAKFNRLLKRVEKYSLEYGFKPIDS